MMQPLESRRHFLTGTNQDGTSAHNRRVVIDALRLSGTQSRAELARATRLTPQTVSNIVADLQRAGLVVAGPPVKLARGQPAVPYQLVPDGAFAIGLHVERHFLRAVAVNLLGEVQVSEEMALPSGGPASGVSVVLALIERTRKRLAQRFPEAEARMAGFGIAMPGPFGMGADYDDESMMGAWRAYPLAEAVAAGTGGEVRLLNDATAATIAEKLTGAAHGFTDLVHIFLGYGLGAGLLIGGDVYEGAFGNAGEIGQILLRAPGAATAAIPAPLEHGASLASLARLLHVPPGDPGLFDAIGAALKRGGPDLEGWIDGAALQLRRAVQIVETLFDPQTVILGGEAPQALLRRLAERIEPLLPSIAARPARQHARLILGGGNRWAVAIGAATEPISRAFDPRFSALLKS